MRVSSNVSKTELYGQTKELLEHLFQQVELNVQHILVFGVSTSEVLGHKIGTAGTTEVAEAIFQVAQEFQTTYDVHLAFQCCEHLNRAIVVERRTVQQFNLDEVTAIPVPQAGGAMAAYAFRQFKQPALVEHIRADAGIDIGDTLIGMHLKHVAVPIRAARQKVGQAHVTMAKTRPKLIGGARAIYSIEGLSSERTDCD